MKTGLYQVFGQNQAVSLLLNALKKDKLSHAYLFYGNSGVGKRFTALRFAYHLFCGKDRIYPCGECAECKKVSKNIHPDMYFIRPERKEITIKQIRDLKSYLRYRPIEGEYKFILIEDAERMNKEAANALLKDLEEPPEYVVYVLLTHNLTRILPTILSRCQPVRFCPVPEKFIEKFLKETYGLPEEAAKFVSKFCQGSPGVAVKIVEKGLLEEIKSFLEIMKTDSWERTFSLCEHLANFDLESIKVFFYVLMQVLWKGYKEKRLKGEKLSKDLRKRVYPVFSLIEATLNNLQFYINAEMAFLNLFLTIKEFFKEGNFFDDKK